MGIAEAVVPTSDPHGDVPAPTFTPPHFPDTFSFSS
jgi:hypothetical protein